MNLSPQQIHQFWRDGYHIQRAAATPDRVAYLAALARSQCAGHATPLELEADVQYPGSPASADAPGGETPRRLLQAFDRDSELEQWARDDQVVKTIRQLLDAEQVSLTLCHHNCIMTKMPNFSSTTMWHQDTRYWQFNNNRLINCWLALGRESLNNGCLRIIPGSHTLELESECFDDARFLKPEHPDVAALIERAQRVELEPGDALFFHAGCFHAAGSNQTQESKYTVIFTYHGADTKPVPASRSSRLPEVVVYP